MSGVVLWSLLVAVALLTHADAEDADYDYPDPQPQLVTKPSEYRVKEGAQLVLPCQVRDLGLYSVVWKKGQRVVSAGQTITAVHRRFRLVRGHDLQIDRVKVKDTGTFTCSVLTEKLIEITHKVDVLYGPTVTTVPESGLVVAQRGTDEMLECLADGKPTPKVFWRKQSGRLPNGEETYSGARFTIYQVTRDMAGVYECVADDGFGTTDVGKISLQVQWYPVCGGPPLDRPLRPLDWTGHSFSIPLHLSRQGTPSAVCRHWTGRYVRPPEVEVERTTVYTGQGYQAKLSCFVYADPPAEVIWKREGSAIDRRRHVPSGNKMGTRHMLTIANVQQDDFDTYTCEAVNSLGEKKGRMIVTGVADRVHITSPPIGSAPEAFDLAWEVESYSPIHEYKVAFRMRKFNTSVDVPSPWKEVIVPTTGSEPVNDILHHQKITLRYLRPATLYDLYIQGSNRHGWNAVSDMFHFSTLARDEALESRVASRSGTSSRRLPVLVNLLLVLVWLGTGQLF